MSWIRLSGQSIELDDLRQHLRDIGGFTDLVETFLQLDSEPRDREGPFRPDCTGLSEASCCRKVPSNY